MNRTILVPLDGSSLAELALPHAQTIARATGWHICPLHVVESLIEYALVPWEVAATGADAPEWQAAMSNAGSYLDSLLVPLRERGLGEMTVRLVGNPAAAITDYVGDHPEVAMIVMTTYGKRGVRQGVFGSIAEKLVHATTVPLLLIPAGMTPQPANAPRYTTILVPLDEPLLAEAALPLARLLAAHNDAITILLHAIPMIEQSGLFPDRHAPNTAHQAVYSAVRAYLVAHALAFEAEGLVVAIQVAEGYPAEVILAVSAEAQVDLIIMGTHGRSGVEQRWLGSVATQVVHATACPVLLVRKEAHHATAL